MKKASEVGYTGLIEELYGVLYRYKGKAPYIEAFEIRDGCVGGRRLRIEGEI